MGRSRRRYCWSHWRWNRCARFGTDWLLGRSLGLRQRKRCFPFSLTLCNGLVFRLVQWMDLGGAVSAFDFNVFRRQANQVFGTQ